MMYKYLHNSKSSAKIDAKLNQSIIERLKKRRIYSDFVEFSSEKELATILSGLKKQSTNTLVIVGDDNDFNILIGQSSKLDNDIVIGYLPVIRTRISKKFKLNSWQDAVEALAQRRVKEKTLYSVSSRYFYDCIELDFGDSQKNNSLQVTTDKGLVLKIPNSKLRFENLNEDRYFHKTPIQITAYHHAKDKQSAAKVKLATRLLARLSPDKNNQPSELILSLHGKNFKIEAPSIALDELGRKYNQTLRIGKSAKTIRLISKRPERQNN